MIRPVRLLPGAAPLLAGLLLLTACAGVPERLPPALQARPEVFLDRLVADEAAVKTVRGLASLRYEGPRGQGSATQVIVVALPDRIRLETLSPMGTAVFLLAIRGGDLTMYAPSRHEYVVGPATQETLGRLARVSVPPGPLLRLLVGLPPLPIYPGDPRVKLAVEDTAIRVESVDGTFWQRVWSSPDGLAPERGELGQGDGPLLAFRFGDRRRLHDVLFPYAVHFDEAATRTSVDIQYETVRLNDSLEADLFELPRPTDGTTRILDLGAGPRPKQAP